MSRLTKYFADGDEYGYELCYGGCESCDGVLCGNALEMINKLVHYEDLEDDGRLIELPCKVGDTVYVADKSAGNIHPFIVDFIEMNKFEKSVLTSYAGKEQNRQQWKIRVSIEQFKELFDITKEEAEAKLAELKGGE